MEVLLAAVVIFVVYLVVSTTVLRVTTRMVAGFTPTFGSATIAIIISAVIMWIVSALLGLLSGGSAPILLLLPISLFVQSMIYAVTICNNKGNGISFGQGFLILVCQIPVALLLGVALVSIIGAGGLSLASLSAWNSKMPTTSIVQQAQPIARQARLNGSVAMATKYGQVTYASGTPVQILEETALGYRVLVNGTEGSLIRNQVFVSDR